MNKKLLTQLYNERRSNAWLLIELLLVSVVLWYIVDSLFVTFSTYTEPRGFDITNTYNIEMGYYDEKSLDYIPNQTDKELNSDMRELIDRLRRHPAVEAVSASLTSYPYNGTNNMILAQIDTMQSNNRVIWRRVTPDFFRVFRYQGANGETPEQLAALLKGDVFMASRNLFQAQYNVDLKDFVNHSFILGGDTTNYYPLVATLENVRYTDFTQACKSTTIVSLLNENWLDHTVELCIRVREGASPTFAEDLMTEASKQYCVGNIFMFKVTSFETIRQNFQLTEMNYTRKDLVGVGFLLVNVFLGLLGTFWFRTHQRRAEIALMMAFGGSKRAMFKRLMSEGLLLLVVVTPLAMLINFNIAYAELTYSWNFTFYSVERFFICVFSTFALIALMILLGIWFPARKAMKIQLAETLHDD